MLMERTWLALTVIDHVTETLNEFLGKLFRSFSLLRKIIVFFWNFDGENISRGFRFLLFVRYFDIFIFTENEMEFKRLNCSLNILVHIRLDRLKY